MEAIKDKFLSDQKTHDVA